MKLGKTGITPESFTTLGELLRFLRARARLSQRDLAAQLVMPDLASIAAPCHIVVGAEDATCPPAMGQWLAGRMTHSATTLQRVAGAGHAFPLLRWTELVMAAAEAG